MTGNKLSHYRIKSALESCTDEKIACMVERIEKIVKRKNVTILSVRTESSGKGSKYMSQFLAGLRGIAERNEIPMHTFDLEALSKHSPVSESQPHSRKALAVSILYEYPYLLREYGKGCNPDKEHYFKIFEAIACAKCAPKP